MSHTAVVILNFNGQHWLEKFLPDVVRYSPEAEVVVADNGSTDQSLDWLKAEMPEVRVIELQKNRGFAEGYNHALSRIEADYYLLLNSDVAVTPNWLPPLLRCLEQNPEAGACQPRLRSFHQPTHFEYAGAAGGWLDKYGYPFCRGRVFDTLEADEEQYATVAPVFWASGACFLIRADLYHRIGGLDADFFAHMEEIDLCWRLQNAGYQVVYCPESTVYHVGGGTLQTGSPFKTYLNFRNNLVMLIKNLPAAQLWQTVFWRMCLDAVAALRFLVRGEFRHFAAVLRAHGYLYARAGFLRKKRRRTQQLAPARPPDELHGWLDKSLIWNYFGRKKTTFRELM